MFRSLVFVEANFEVANIKSDAGEYSTQYIVKHGKEYALPIVPDENYQRD